MDTFNRVALFMPGQDILVEVSGGAYAAGTVASIDHDTRTLHLTDGRRFAFPSTTTPPAAEPEKEPLDE